MKNNTYFEIKNWHDLTWDELKKFARIWNEEYPTIIDRYHLPKLTGKKPLLSEHSKHWKIILARKKNHPKENIIGFIQLQLSRENDRICFFIMAIDRSHQRMGIGTKLLEKAKELVDELHGWVIVEDIYFKEDGSPYHSPLQFYLRNGFELGKKRYVKEKNLLLKEVIWRKQ